MESTRSFRDLEVWQLAMTLVETAYLVTRQLPRDEFDLRRQIRRAAVSIPANIAEGARRKYDKAFRLHVSIALGSQAELETEIEIAVCTKLLTVDQTRELNALTERVGQMLTRLYQSLRPSQH